MATNHVYSMSYFCLVVIAFLIADIICSVHNYLMVWLPLCSDIMQEEKG